MLCRGFVRWLGAKYVPQFGQRPPRAPTMVPHAPQLRALVDSEAGLAPVEGGTVLVEPAVT